MTIKKTWNVLTTKYDFEKYQKSKERQTSDIKYMLFTMPCIVIWDSVYWVISI